ncbi:UBX domain-containing protein 7-like [Tropilaelaps mercedesae]|uniref:UBX domain-containing protein 7-like n=1 Tax=Tropilaelaps mercedesae TaxID=418985 RepID=A0A1V9X109_9ACAR|nr:UBX domain-containing protein 7-like [Tropilaelaps mercedesae]
MAEIMASTDFEKRVQEFKEITGADDNLATQMLQICQGNLQMAINMHVDGGGIDIGAKDTAGPPRHPRPPPSPPLAADFPTSNSGNLGAGPSNGEYVRPPLPPKQEVLVNYTGYGEIEQPSGASRRGVSRAGGIVEPFRDLRRETQLQEEHMERGAGAIENMSSVTRRATGLEDLFRPPIDLMFKGTLDGARDEGRRRNKWILVNVVDPTNFQCQTLNRDVWSSDLVKDIIKDSFIFWQVYNTSEDGTNYSCFYPIDMYPHVAVLDPLTGERLINWSKLDACTFTERVTDFLGCSPCPDETQQNTSDAEAAGSSGTAPPLKKPKSNSTFVSVVEDMDEDEQMKAAIAASLQNEPTTADTGVQPKAAEESYTKYLGPESDPKSELMFRYPDGERRVHSFPSTSRLRALTLFAHEQGFSESSHELVTNYPRRNLSELDSSLMLNEVGLYPKETIFIQLRSA